MLISVKDLSDRAAAALARYCGDNLYLDCLSSASDAVIKSLAGFKGGLTIGLRSLSPIAGAVLAKRAGDLFFPAITDLSDASIPLLERASSQSAYVSEQGPGPVSIKFFNVAIVSDRAAEVLARYPGELELPGVRSLSDSAAESLGGRSGRLSLCGLESLTVRSAAAIARRRGRLDLSQVTSISKDVATALATHDGPLSLGLSSLTKAVAAALAKHKGELSLLSLEGLSDACVNEMARHGNLILPDDVRTRVVAVEASL